MTVLFTGRKRYFQPKVWLKIQQAEAIKLGNKNTLYGALYPLFQRGAVEQNLLKLFELIFENAPSSVPAAPET